MAAPKSKPRPLTPRQRRFVEALPTARSQTEAAIIAGYSPTGGPAAAGVRASENVRKRSLIPALQAQQLATTNAAIATAIERKTRLSTILREDYKGPVFARDVISASDQLNRMESVYVDRSVNLNASVDLAELEGFSLEELRALLAAATSRPQAVPPSRKAPKARKGGEGD